MSFTSALSHIQQLMLRIVYTSQGWLPTRVTSLPVGFLFFLFDMNLGWALFQVRFSNPGQLCSTLVDTSHSERRRRVSNSYEWHVSNIEPFIIRTIFPLLSRYKSVRLLQHVSTTFPLNAKGVYFLNVITYIYIYIYIHKLSQMFSCGYSEFHVLWRSPGNWQIV